MIYHPLPVLSLKCPIAPKVQSGYTYRKFLMKRSSSAIASSNPDPFLFLMTAGGSSDSMKHWDDATQALQ